jgi:phosphoribosyl 1,2-cyclic phosphodiesterase
MRTSEYRSKLKKILSLVPGRGFSDADEINRFIIGLPDQLSSVTGGNTTCISVLSGNHECIIDMGSGARVLGDRLMQGDAGKGKAEIDVFITHTHWDHICGIPFFKPLYIPGNIINFYSPLSDLQERFQYQQTERFFPLPFDQMPATKNFHTIKPGELMDFGNKCTIDGLALKHPGGSFAYRFKENNRTFIFATDVEFTGEYLEHPDENTDNFFQDANLMVIDAQYTLDESMKKFDWGHTSISMAVNCASRWNVKNVMLTHHEPSYSDLKLMDNLKIGKIHSMRIGNRSLNVYLAREGIIVKL